jgi:predicted RNA binding protein with dsRBD fold (UPF0201 family)
MALSTYGLNATSITTATTINITLIKGVQVSGTVSLPNGEVAPVSGIQVSIYFSGNQYYSRTVVIPAGQNSGSYSLNIPTGNYNIGYDYSGNTYVRNGYFSNGITVPQFVTTELNADKTINITLIKGVIVQTTVRLPNGEIARGNGVSIEVYFSGVSTQYAYVNIPSGQNSALVTKVLPTGSYLISYYYWGPDYVRSGYYVAGTMVMNQPSSREIITTNQSITIELIKGIAVGGTISLPNGEVAPVGGIQVTVILEGNQSKQVTIPAGQNSVTYAFTGNITPGNYYISYSYSGNNYVQQGYYNAGSMALSTYGLNATSITTATTINLTLIKGVQIELTAKLPDGETAPQNGQMFLVVFSGFNQEQYFQITIPSGKNSQSISKSLPSGSYMIGSYYNSTQGYVWNGYYIAGVMSLNNTGQVREHITSPTSITIQRITIN